MLLLADRRVREEFKSHFDSQRLMHHNDPYEALLAMGRRRWPVIVLAVANSDWPALCRASRRLQSAAKLYVVCSTAAEPQVRDLVGKVLDDYFIYPPTPSELAEIRRAASSDAGRPGEDGQLSPPQFADLVAAAKSVSGLETHLSAMLGNLLGMRLIWTDAADGTADGEPLLLSAGDAPRVLTSVEPTRTIDQPTRRLLADIQRVLPALITAAERTDRLHRLSITDNLTGAHNRRSFYNLTDQILLRARQRDFRVTLLLYDIDDFKRYNDAYGHAAGDEILRQTARLMHQITRSHDIVARIGGDEFAVLFWDAEPPRSPDSQPPETAYSLADRFRRAVVTMEFPSLGPEATGVLTISGGLAAFPDDGKTCRELLRQADQALRAAKASGKNAIFLIGQK